jgi:hypothetical protein
MCQYPLDWRMDGSHSKFNLDAVVAGEKKIAAVDSFVLLLLSNV